MKFQDILNEQRFQFTVDGYGYNEEEDFAEPDEPSKKWHYMTTPEGERITLDHSPYQWMDKDEFAEYVARHKASIQEDSTDIQYPDYDDSEGEVKEAFLAGYQEGRIAGFDDGAGSRPFGQKEETPEEAYEYWIKHDRGTT